MHTICYMKTTDKDPVGITNMTLTDEDAVRFIEALNAERKPNKKLIEAFNKYKATKELDSEK